jgi:hypothetical protein
MKKTKNKQKTISQLIKELLKTDMYHPHLVENLNKQLSEQIQRKISNSKTDKKQHIYVKIQDVSNRLSILAHAAIYQSMLTRMMSNKQFEIIQKELKVLKNQLQH